MKEPVFNTLRTELQLGYSVFCQPVNTNGILGFTIVVEAHANKFEYVAYAAKVGEDCVRRDIVHVNCPQGNFTRLHGFRQVQSQIHTKVKHARKPFFFFCNLDQTQYEVTADSERLSQSFDGVVVVTFIHVECRHFSHSCE